MDICRCYGSHTSESQLPIYLICLADQELRRTMSPLICFETVDVSDVP